MRRALAMLALVGGSFTTPGGLSCAYGEFDGGTRIVGHCQGEREAWHYHTELLPSGAWTFTIRDATWSTEVIAD